MKVGDLIDYLKRNYSPDDAIVVAWWDQDSFSDAHDMDEDEWAKATVYMDEMDWSYTHDALEYTLNEYLRMGDNA